MRVSFETRLTRIEDIQVGDQVCLTNLDAFAISTVLGLGYGPRPNFFTLTLSTDGMPQYVPAGSYVHRVVGLRRSF